MRGSRSSAGASALTRSGTTASATPKQSRKAGVGSSADGAGGMDDFAIQGTVI